MSDRRRAARHVFNTQMASDVLLLEDVTIERLAGDSVVVTCSTAYRTDDSVVVQLIEAETPSNLAATVVSTQPLLVAGAAAFRVALRIDRALRGADGCPPGPARTRRDTPRTAVLLRRRSVDVNDVSRKGGCFAADEPLALGAVGVLSVMVDGRGHVEMFRVTRVDAAAGSGRRYAVGVEFLPMPAGGPFVHDVAAGLDEALAS